MKSRAEGLILMSFDQEDSLQCQNWTMEINYDLNMKDQSINVFQEAEYNEIPCLQEWRELIYSDIVPTEENPVRQKVGDRD